MEQMTGDSMRRRRRAAAEMLFSRWSDVVLASHPLLLRSLPFVIAAAAILAVSASDCRATIIRFNTSLGNIDVRMFNTATPLSVANFLNYVTSNRYAGTFIHRVPQLTSGGSADFVVQGGGFLLNNSIFAAAGIVTDPPIGNEPGISNIRGTLAFAKNSLGATSQWFFNIGNNSGLDAQDFTVFGRVLGTGMNVVDAINDLPTINASAAQNAPGEDFDEIPVTDLAKVLAQNDIKNSEAVMVNSVTIRNLPAGDYDFNGLVNGLDFAIWKADFGSTTNVAADGNGNGRVDAADYAVWRNTFGQSSGSGSGLKGLDGSAAPEPGTLFLMAVASGFSALLARPRRNTAC
jgi:cyclophilin family peptidyl-prolyl cis-trans isomerase